MSTQAQRVQAPSETASEGDAAACAIELANVDFAYGELTVLSGITLDVARGERVAVVGASGCGKSTLLSIVAGLLSPSSGAARVTGQVALMPQRDLLVPWRDALGNAALALEAQGVTHEEAIAKAAPLFESFGLASFERSKPWELSGGMRQRVAFLRTVLTGRPILALDEPFGALDSITRAEMQEWLTAALDAQPHTLLLVTHDVEEALAVAGRVLVMTPRPGRFATQIAVDRPGGASRRDWVTSPEFAELKAAALEALE